MRYTESTEDIEMAWNKWTGIALWIVALVAVIIGLTCNVAWLIVVCVACAIAGVVFWKGKKDADAEADS